jgi:hypothetical protein
MNTDIFGAFIFGLVIGYITYRTLIHAKRTAIGEISGVIAVIGGGVITAEFISDIGAFTGYAVGLAVSIPIFMVYKWRSHARDHANDPRT